MTKRQAYFKQYYLAHKAKIKKQTRAYAKAHRKRTAKMIRRWKLRNWQHRMRVERKRQVNIKIEVLSHYGPAGRLQCSWPDCEVTDIDMLSLDHIHNDGAEHRRNLFGKKQGSSGSLYCYVRSRGWPAGFQTLCMNHQWKKEGMRRRKEYNAKFQRNK
jgi:hypothetical protein